MGEGSWWYIAWLQGNVWYWHISYKIITCLITIQLVELYNLSQHLDSMCDLFMPSIARIKASPCLTVWLCVDRLQNAEGIISDGHSNYTEDNKCMWLVDTGQNQSLWFQFHQFSTECGWDHLYIYDGDSAFAPLLAAFRYILVVRTFSSQ